MAPIKLRYITTPTLLMYGCISIAILLLIAYIVFQARFLIAGPQVTMTFVPDIVQAQRQITLEGKTKNITEISINGRSIATDENGNFSENIILENGYTIVSIEARDRYGRETRHEHQFVYTPLSLLPS